MKRLLLAMLCALQAAAAGEISLEDAKKNGMREALQNYITHNPIITDICVYEQEWVPASETFPKGQMIQRAVVTYVHCGPWRVGQKIEYTHYIEDAPRFFGRFVSTVPGKLRTFFYEPDGSETQEDGAIRISGDGHWGFARVDDVFAELFLLELKTNPKLTTKSK